MRTVEIARRLAQLNETEQACQAYILALHELGGADPDTELEAALYILQFGSGENYKISYTVFRDLYNAGFCKEDMLQIMDGAFYTPNLKLMQTRYRKNCALLGKYPYIFRKDFLKFEDLPIRFYPFDDNSYTPFYVEEERFGDYIDFREPVIKHYFFNDLENPILAKDVYSQYELEYLRDNVRRSEDVARENHIYLHYTSWREFCACLACLNIKPLLEEKKIVFLFEEEIEQYPIDFKERFRIDYSKLNVRPLAIREVTRMIWHGQLSSHNGGDLFNEVFDAHPNLIAMPSILMSNIEETIEVTRRELEESGSLAEAQQRLSYWNDPKLIEELYHNRARTDKDILIGMYLYRKEYTGFLDPNSRIVPALFFQPHFSNIIYSMRSDSKGRTVLYSEEYETIRTSPVFLGFKYIKTFLPMRRPTTSHGGTVKFMDGMAAYENEHRNEDGVTTVATDAVSERVMNRSFMVDKQDRICRDSVIVRFEDGKLNPTATFTALAAFLDLPYTQTMTKCTDCGKEAIVPGKATGFDPVTVYKTYDEYVNDKERIFIEFFLRDAYQYYGYDFHYYDGKPMDKEQVDELLKGFDTIDSYIRKTWRLAVARTEVWQDGVLVEDEKVRDEVHEQMVDNYIQRVWESRRKMADVLMNDLRFVGKNGQPLHMMPLLKPSPELLEQPLYH
ncbi:hypothetical protein [Flintibacter muris]|uniref:hypothetical protein n=1 Tax=Flintibacter muris TaxID=2941327 RepID=UPI00203FB74B|nr:hypothetical protein [Flintibacter muris]